MVHAKLSRAEYASKRTLSSARTTQVRLKEILSGSIYKNSSKNRGKLSLVLRHFSSAITNDLTMTFTSRLNIDAKSANEQ